MSIYAKQVYIETLSTGYQVKLRQKVQLKINLNRCKEEDYLSTDIEARTLGVVAVELPLLKT